MHELYRLKYFYFQLPENTQDEWELGKYVNIITAPSLVKFEEPFHTKLGNSRISITLGIAFSVLFYWSYKLENIQIPTWYHFSSLNGIVYNYLYVPYCINKKDWGDFICIFYGPSHGVRKSWHQFSSSKLLVESGRVWVGVPRVRQMKVSSHGPGHYWGQSSSCFHIFFICKWGSHLLSFQHRLFKVVSTDLSDFYQE